MQALETSELSRRVAALAQSTWLAVAPAAAPVAAAAPQDPDPLAEYARRVVVLFTSMTRDQLATVATRKLLTQLDSLSVEVVQLEGQDSANHAARKELWKRAGATPGSYPILFVGSTGVCCTSERIQEMIDMGKLPSVLGLAESSPEASEAPLAESSAGAAQSEVPGREGASAAWRGYLRQHLALLEDNMAAAATATIAACPERPLMRLAAELDTRVVGNARHVSEPPSETKSAAAEAPPPLTLEREEQMRLELEGALEAALDAALDVLPAEPLLFLAEHIRKHYGS